MNSRLEQVKKDIALLEEEKKRLERPEWKHGDVAVTRDGKSRIFIKIGDRVRLFAPDGEMIPFHKEGTPGWYRWLESFGYRKTGNIFKGDKL